MFSVSSLCSSQQIPHLLWLTIISFSTNLTFSTHNHPHNTKKNLKIKVTIYMYVSQIQQQQQKEIPKSQHNLSLSLSLSLSLKPKSLYLLHLTFHFTKCSYDYKEYKQENNLFGYAIWNMNLRFVILLHIITIGITYLGVRFRRFRGSWYVEMWRKSLDTRNSTNNYTPV